MRAERSQALYGHQYVSVEENFPLRKILLSESIFVYFVVYLFVDLFDREQKRKKHTYIYKKEKEIFHLWIYHPNDHRLNPGVQDSS